MKLKFKAIAAAVALVAAGAAHADLVAASTGNSSFAMVAFNVVTNAYYVRDLGYTLNTFLPSNVTTGANDGAVTGDKTPEAGFNTNFGGSDSTWTTWLAGQNAADVRWTVAAGDAVVGSGATASQSRSLVAINGTVGNITNVTVRTSVGSSNGVSGLAFQNAGMGTSATGATVLGGFLSNNGYGAGTLGLLDVASSLYYYVTSTSTGSSAASAIANRFGNSAGFATLTLASNGVLTYDLQPAAVSQVPLPGSIWMMGVGMLAVGGMLRRRKAIQA